MPEIDDPDVIAAAAIGIDALSDPQFVKTAEMTAALADKAAASHSHDAATTGAAGFMSAADKTKLDGVEAGATADQTGAEMVTALNAELGSATWQSGGSGAPAWGTITGTLADQTDLDAALAGKAAASHTHSYPGMLCLHKTWVVGSNQTLTAGTAATVAFNTLRKSVASAPDHTISSGVVTFAATGSVQVEAQLTIADTSSTTKGSVVAQFQYDSGAGYAAIGDAMTVAVPTSADADLTCASLVISAEVDVTAGQPLKLVATAKSSAANCTVRAGSKLVVKGIS